MTTESGLVTNTYHDDSAAPVHIQVRVCRSDSAQRQQTYDCAVDTGYAVIGGGAWAQYTGGGALLTGSYPLSDGRTWRGRSKDVQTADSHNLHTYAIGLRLDGVNAATLRSSLLVRSNFTGPPFGPVPQPGVSVSAPFPMLAGGALTVTSGPGQYLTRMVPSGGMMGATSKEHLASSPGQITAHMVSIRGTFGTAGLIEGFGALEIQEAAGSAVTVGSGVGTSTASVASGWALAGIRPLATTSSGPGRMLFRVGTNGSARSIIVQSKDQGQTSGGVTTASWTQVRKKANSHGLCNTGSAMSASMDSCVASVCASDSYCCSTSWDATCVNEVTSICGRQCTAHTCSLPSYEPTFWNDGSTVQNSNNCYNYSTNTRTDTFAQPGRSSGESCSSESCVSVATIKKYATNDGLIPTTLAAGCGGDQDLLALVIAPAADYHWYRRDADGMWTHKPGSTDARNTDNAGNVITNPQTADRGPYTQFAGYFCTCSSYTHGAGHAVIN